MAEGNKEELLNPGKAQVEIITDNKERTLAIIKETKWNHSLLNTTNGAILLEIQKENIPELNRLLVEKEVNIFSIRPRHSLEDFFLSLTAH